ncbi:glycosyltransferase family 2 protein [Sphaerospermopsis torques-reginae]|uniref:Glycosyltransferase n=1 Tax=Sphaerospermopsis torques-reginae ITEP-024 TaxID=984208 RepID=A0ABX8WU35_9CYAN|nr:glycosyltransferase [Sphaerospermopsis torques-reginae]QYX29900.1 glycosyltransferase [Sphaerospermopsis torques-reginae ITEP-024]
MIPHRVIACVPTYREPEKVADFLKSCENIRYRPFKLIIVNANPGDETSKIIEKYKVLTDYEISEVYGQADEFWSATVNRGLNAVLKDYQPDDWVLISNVDIKFTHDIVSLLLEEAIKHRNCQIGAICTSDHHVISSGVQIKSWLATLTRHPYAGVNANDLESNLLIKVEYLPTRCIIFPAETLTKVGLVADKWLPHYGADYEFSRRLARAGYTPYIYTGVSIEVDTKNTGKSIYSTKSSLFERISNLMSMKNPSNPRFRIIFVLLVYPLYAIPTAVVAYLLRSFIEISFDKHRIVSIFGKHERGFSE